MSALKRVAPGKLIAACISICVSAAAQEHIVDAAIAPLFASDLPLHVTIEAPLTTLMRDRSQEIYLDGHFRVTANDGTERTFDLKIRTRGKYRRQENHCDFTPIRLNFRKKQVADTILARQDKLKLVTHCKNGSARYDQLVVREYLAYRILEVMTERSYGVRLLQIDYVDTESGKLMTKPGFVIEDDDAVAERNGMRTIEGGNLSVNDLDRRQQNLVNVFQYLIGNTEYSLSVAEPEEHCCHNIDLMSATDAPPYTPLAYDFDFAGIVNAPYAEPNPRFAITDVRKRLYRGQCDNNDFLPDTIQQFIDRKDAIYSIVDEVEMLSAESKEYVTRYLNSSYEHISTAKSVQARFIDRCEDPPPTKRDDPA